MPSSRADIIAPVVNLMVNMSPSSILDVGCGFGKFGFLSREYLENRNEQEPFRRPEEWRLTVDAIEGFSPYVGSLHRIIYNNVFIGDALEEVRNRNRYDLIICSEMIEHCERVYGLWLIDAMIKKSKKGVIITTPVDPSSQGAIHGNELERHVSKWKETDFPTSGKWDFYGAGRGKFMIAVYDHEKM